MRFGKIIIIGMFIMAVYCQAKDKSWEWAKYGIPESKNPACIPTLRRTTLNVRLTRQAKQQKPGQTVPVMFLGDSITQLWSFDKKHKFPGGLDSWNKHFKPMKAVNFGISGERVEHALWRITAGEQLKINPKVIVLMIGTNNLHGKRNSSAQIATGIKLIIDVIKQKSPQSKILLLPIPPNAWTHVTKKKKEVNNALAGYADNKRVFYFDASPILLKEGKVTKTIFRDGIHLSPQGYEIFAKALLPEIKKLLNKK